MTKISTPSQPHLPLFEALEYGDMRGMIKPTIHVDEFASKIGDDEDIIVISFFVRSLEAAKDLINWFEKGYDWVLDADRSPGEIRPGRYLVYVEMRRRSSAGQRVSEMLEDLATLTEHSVDDWQLVYDGNRVPFSQETFDRLVPRSPREYQRQQDSEVNEMRVAAGIEPKKITSQPTPEIRALQSAAGI